jgi:hypothetical protein
MIGYDGEILQRVAEALKIKVKSGVDGMVGHDRIGAIETR